MSAPFAIFAIILVLALALAEQAREWARLGRMARELKQQEERV